jgi:hypothetical protein
MASGLCAALTGRTHGCTDQPANVKKTLANSEPSTHGTKRTCPPRRSMSAFGGQSGHGVKTAVGLLLTHLGHSNRGAKNDRDRPCRRTVRACYWAPLVQALKRPNHTIAICLGRIGVFPRTL